MYNVHMETKLTTSEMIIAATQEMRTASIARAMEWANSQINNALEMIAIEGMMDYPSATRKTREAWMSAKRKYDLQRTVWKFINVEGGCRGVRNDDGIERFLEATKIAAENQFDAYVAKMVLKLGDGVESVSVHGTDAWRNSILSVTRTDGAKEEWYTQTIVNCSVLGTLFNQFPTRKLKPAKSKATRRA